DILKFVTSFLDELKLAVPHGNAHWATKLTEGAQGAFVWVRLVGEELRRYSIEGYTTGDVIRFLESLPTELEEIYKDTLGRLERGTRRNIELGQKMFQYVLFAYRPLGQDELQQALAIRENNDSESSLSDESFQEDLIQD